ncbi:MAG: hypothetical protein U0L76_01105 [Ruminococcus sp.]|nr:hypothetical protein [Ruminococcus sp.]
MTNEEMIQKYYDGNESMLEKLYNENIGFIHSIAKESSAAFNCFHKKENRPQELTVYRQLFPSFTPCMRLSSHTAFHHKYKIIRLVNTSKEYAKFKLVCYAPFFLNYLSF